MNLIKQSDYTKIKRFFDRNTRHKQVADIPIIKKINNTEFYVGLYHIIKTNEGWEVSFSGKTTIFGTNRNAMYFALLDYYGKRKEVSDLLKFDNRITNYQANIKRYYSHMEKTTDFWKYQLFCNKLSEEEARFSEVRADLRNWFNLTKYMKLGI